MHLVRYRESQELLMATPPSLPEDFLPDTDAVRPIIETALRSIKDDQTQVAGKLGSTRSRWRACSRPMAFRSRRRRLARDAEEAVAAARPYLAEGIPSFSRFLRLTSCINQKSAAYGSTSPADRPCARQPRIF